MRLWTRVAAGKSGLIGARQDKADFEDETKLDLKKLDNTVPPDWQ